MRTTWPAASFSQRRVRCRSVTASSPRGVTRQASYQRWYSAGELFDVARDAVRLAQLGGLPDDARQLGEGAEQRALGLVGQQRGVERATRSTPAASAFRATDCVRAWAYWT